MRWSKIWPSGEAYRKFSFGQFSIDLLYPLICCCCCCVASVDGHLYTWGRGFSGTPDAHLPQCLLSSFLFTRAALGWNHALALTSMQIHFLFLHSLSLSLVFLCFVFCKIAVLVFWHLKQVMGKFLCSVAATMESLAILRKWAQSNYLVWHLSSWEYPVVLLTCLSLYLPHKPEPSG